MLKFAIIAAICVFSTQFGVTVVAPLLGMWVSAVENPYVASALIFAAFTLVSTPLQIPAGKLSDKFGRKQFIVAGLLLYAVASALFPIFSPSDALTHASSVSLCGLILARALQGAGAGLFFPSITAFLTERTSEAERGEAFSIYNIGLGAGLALGPLAGGALTNSLNATAPFVACVSLALFSAFLVLFLVQEEKLTEVGVKRGKMSGKTSKKQKNALILACIVIFFGIGVAAIMSSMFSPYAKSKLNFSETLIGIFISAMLAVFAILQRVLSGISRKIGEVPLATLGVLLCASGLASLAFTADPQAILLISFILGAGLGAVSLSTLTLASYAANTGEGAGEGEIMGVYFTIFYAGLGTIPLVCGFLSEILGAKRVFLLYALTLFALAPFILQAGRKLSKISAL
ncbi:MAG: MFS transporter [Candidatus Methanospirare jalkutatii]|nr:MAG: MFS transporter [Candidatus Methanospirare jalkutatii]UYZ40836.1 MAG: MFS transporter [Candidatus Methanospirare jalkutatii]